MSFIESETKEEGRYELRLRWDKDSGHVVCIERVNGMLVFYDPQSGKKGDSLFGYDNIDYLEKAINIGVRRMDDKLINPKMFSRLIVKTH